MRLTFLGHAAVQLEIGEYEVLIDPFLSGDPAASTTSETLAPSHVLLPHAHADHFTMGPDDALEAVKLLSPRGVVPVHDDTFPHIHQDADAFRARVEDETDARCHVLGPGDVLDV